MAIQRVSPQNGGCWYCHLQDEFGTNGMVFSYEFDTYLHMECLISSLRRDPSDPEARIIAKELHKELDNWINCYKDHVVTEKPGELEYHWHKVLSHLLTLDDSNEE